MSGIRSYQPPGVPIVKWPLSKNLVNDWRANNEFLWGAALRTQEAFTGRICYSILANPGKRTLIEGYFLYTGTKKLIWRYRTNNALWIELEDDLHQTPNSARKVASGTVGFSEYTDTVDFTNDSTGLVLQFTLNKIYRFRVVAESNPPDMEFQCKLYAVLFYSKQNYVWPSLSDWVNGTTPTISSDFSDVPTAQNYLWDRLRTIQACPPAMAYSGTGITHDLQTPFVGSFIYKGQNRLLVRYQQYSGQLQIKIIGAVGTDYFSITPPDRKYHEAEFDLKPEDHVLGSIVNWEYLTDSGYAPNYLFSLTFSDGPVLPSLNTKVAHGDIVNGDSGTNPLKNLLNTNLVSIKSKTQYAALEEGLYYPSLIHGLSWGNRVFSSCSFEGGDAEGFTGISGPPILMYLPDSANASGTLQSGSDSASLPDLFGFGDRWCGLDMRGLNFMVPGKMFRVSGVKACYQSYDGL